MMDVAKSSSLIRLPKLASVSNLNYTINSEASANTVSGFLEAMPFFNSSF